MALVPDADEAMADTSSPEGYARHLTNIRRDRTDSTAELLAALADLNAEAVRNATRMEQAARFLRPVAESEMPMNALDVDIRPMAALAEAQAEWFADLAVALKDQHDRVAAEVAD